MLILFDLDETLLDDQKNVSEFTIKTLQYFQSKGHKLAINSARPILFSNKYSELIGCDYNICNAGAQIFKKEELIYSKLISRDMVNAFLQQCDGCFKNITVQSDYAYSWDKDYSDKNTFVKYFDFKSSFFDNAYKIVVDSTNDEKIIQFCQEHGFLFCKYYGKSWARISPSDKAQGMLELMKISNESQSVAFGDDTGDLEMLKAASYGVCMSNSIDTVLNEISTITDFDYNHDGVARHLLKMEEEGLL